MSERVGGAKGNSKLVGKATSLEKNWKLFCFCGAGCVQTSTHGPRFRLICRERVKFVLIVLFLLWNKLSVWVLAIVDVLVTFLGGSFQTSPHPHQPAYLDRPARPTASVSCLGVFTKHKAPSTSVTTTNYTFVSKQLQTTLGKMPALNTSPFMCVWISHSQINRLQFSQALVADLCPVTDSCAKVFFFSIRPLPIHNLLTLFPSPRARPQANEM